MNTLTGIEAEKVSNVPDLARIWPAMFAVAKMHVACSHLARNVLS